MDFVQAEQELVKGKKIYHETFGKGYYLYKKGEDLWVTIGKNRAKNPGKKIIKESLKDLGNFIILETIIN